MLGSEKLCLDCRCVIILVVFGHPTCEGQELNITTMQRGRVVRLRQFFSRGKSSVIEEGVDAVETLVENRVENVATVPHEIRRRSSRTYQYFLRNYRYRELRDGGDDSDWDWDIIPSNDLSESAPCDSSVQNHRETSLRSRFVYVLNKLRTMLTVPVINLIRLALVFCVLYFLAEFFCIVWQPVFRSVQVVSFVVSPAVTCVFALLIVACCFRVKRDKLDYSNYCGDKPSGIASVQEQNQWPRLHINPARAHQ